MVLSVPTIALVYLKPMEQHTVRKYCIYFSCIVTLFKRKSVSSIIYIRDPNVPLQVGRT